MKSLLKQPPLRAQICCELLETVLDVDGHIIELGVYKGDTTYAMASILKEKKLSKRIIACDCFTGLPYSEGELQQGECRSSYLEFMMNTHDVQAYVVPIVGNIEYTLPSLATFRYCFAFLDLDLYKSTVVGIEHVLPRVRPGGIIGFHDYKFHRTPGIEKAVEELVRPSHGMTEIKHRNVADNLIFFRKEP